MQPTAPPHYSKLPRLTLNLESSCLSLPHSRDKRRVLPGLAVGTLILKYFILLLLSTELFYFYSDFLLVRTERTVEGAEGSVGKLPAVQAEGPEFGSPEPTLSWMYNSYTTAAGREMGIEFQSLRVR